MRIIYIKAKNIKSIPDDCDVLNFCENGDFEVDKVFPVSTMILGGNGVSKSTFLEGIALLSHVNIMSVCKKDDDPRLVKEPSYFEVKICLTFDKNTDPNKKGAKDFITFVFAAREDKDSKEFSRKTASLLSSHIVDEEKINKHWCVYYPPKENRDGLIDQYKETLKYNRPQYPISPIHASEDNTAFKKLNDLGELNRKTGRAQDLFAFDDAEDKTRKDELEAELARNSTVVFINTDQNDYGAGLHIFESPKNIKTDLPLVIHHRLPFTKINGSLRHLDRMGVYWKEIFKCSYKENDPKPTEVVIRSKTIKKVECKKNKDGKFEATFVMINDYGKEKTIETLSAGENEVFFVLSTIVSLKLHNSVLLLDEPELHLGLNQLHSYYNAVFKLAHEFDLQLIIVTQMPFLLGYLLNKSIGHSTEERFLEKIKKETEIRLLEPQKGKEKEDQATKLVIKNNKWEIAKNVFENEIFNLTLESVIKYNKKALKILVSEMKR